MEITMIDALVRGLHKNVRFHALIKCPDFVCSFLSIRAFLFNFFVQINLFTCKNIKHEFYFIKNGAVSCGQQILQEYC